MVISQRKRAKFEHYIEVANEDVMQVVIKSGRSRKVSGNMERYTCFVVRIQTYTAK